MCPRILNVEYLLDSVSWHGVEEEEEEVSQEEDEYHLDDHLLEALTDDVATSLKRVHEPQERGIRATDGLVERVRKRYEC